MNTNSDLYRSVNYHVIQNTHRLGYKMSKAGRDKGVRGENEFCNALAREIGVRLERNLDQCRNGGCDLLPAEHEDNWGPIESALARHSIEVKRQAVPKISLWWQQTVEQAKAAGKRPVLAYRLDRGQWRVRVPLREFGLYMFDEGDLEGTAELSLPAWAAFIRERAL